MTSLRGVDGLVRPAVQAVAQSNQPYSVERPLSATVDYDIFKAVPSTAAAIVGLIHRKRLKQKLATDTCTISSISP
jgi:hypothetical protein